MTVQTVLRALDMARLRRGAFHGGLSFSLDRAHSDAGSQYTSVRYGERLAEIGAVPSVGSVGDSYDNALAESVNAFYKAELVFGPGRGAWRDVSHLEATTMSSFTWWRRPGFTAISETGARRSLSGPTLHTTTPPANQESKVRSLQGSQGEPVFSRGPTRRRSYGFGGRPVCGPGARSLALCRRWWRRRSARQR